MGRRARVVVWGADGPAPIVEPEVPWWGEARSLVDAAEAAVGHRLRLLRRLSVEGGQNGHDSEVTYLFEREGGPAADEPDHPLRSPWARSGWIDQVLSWEPVAERLVGRPVQEKWWNLSAVLEIPTNAASLWLKAIPAFFASEAALVDCLRRAQKPVPNVVAHARTFGLYEHIEGADQWDPSDEVVGELIDKLVDIQLWSAPRLSVFEGARVHDRRAGRLAADFSALVKRTDVRSTLDPAEAEELDAAVALVVSWAYELETCGLPVTLLHGDFHPGNTRGVPGDLVILDWTDAAVGSPLLDIPTFLVRLPAERAAAAREGVAMAWSRHVRGIDFDRAFALAEPLRAAIDALVYQEFLDGIEPSERIDHEQDVPASLRRVIESARRLRS